MRRDFAQRYDNRKGPTNYESRPPLQKKRGYRDRESDENEEFEGHYKRRQVDNEQPWSD